MSRIVAHRGQSATHPENTLESIQQAIDCGARAVEFDVQMTADNIPVLSHDANLFKTAGIDINITQQKFNEIKNVSVGEPSRFGDHFSSVTLTSLRDIVSMLATKPDVLVFVELKNESFTEFGIDGFVLPVLEQLSPIRDHCVVISDNSQAISRLGELSDLPTGWVVRRWRKTMFEQAYVLKIQYLVVNHRYFSDWQHAFSSDPWQWFMYETSDVDKAQTLFKQGISFVETDDACHLLQYLPQYK